MAAAATILIVDDEPLFLDVVSLMLGKQGYNVLKAGGPRHALDILRSQPPIDVVLSDIRMPEMRGTDLVRKVEQIVPQAACILMTAGVTELENVPQGVPLLRKPFSTPELISAVMDALARSEEQRAELRRSVEKSAQLRLKCRQLVSECKDVLQQAAETIEESGLQIKPRNQKLG